jgi:hypothetical protein
VQEHRRGRLLLGEFERVAQPGDGGMLAGVQHPGEVML